MVAMSTPALSKCTAVLCRMLWGCRRLVASVDVVGVGEAAVLSEQVAHPEAGQAAAAMILEQGLARRLRVTPFDEPGAQDVGGLRPERAEPLLPALAHQAPVGAPRGGDPPPRASRSLGREYPLALLRASGTSAAQ